MLKITYWDRLVQSVYIHMCFKAKALPENKKNTLNRKKVISTVWDQKMTKPWVISRSLKLISMTLHLDVKSSTILLYYVICYVRDFTITNQCSAPYNWPSICFETTRSDSPAGKSICHTSATLLALTICLALYFTIWPDPIRPGHACSAINLH